MKDIMENLKIYQWKQLPRKEFDSQEQIEEANRNNSAIKHNLKGHLSKAFLKRNFTL